MLSSCWKWEVAGEECASDDHSELTVLSVGGRVWTSGCRVVHLYSDNLHYDNIYHPSSLVTPRLSSPLLLTAHSLFRIFNTAPARCFTTVQRLSRWG